MNKHLFPFLPLLLFFSWSCQEATSPTIDEAYQAEMDHWKAERLASLKAPDGWPALAGLFKLNPGINTFGSASDNDLVFPDHAPAHMGNILVEEERTILRMNEHTPVRIQDSIVQEVVLSSQSPISLEYESLNWHLLERGNQLFIRLRDTLHPARFALDRIPHFSIDPQWRVQARFLAFDTPKTLPVRNVLDMNIDQQCEGVLQFQVDGQTYEIWPIDGGPDEFFLIIADLTTGEETYGGGRYLYVPRPDSTGFTTIDFNKAYNPPCVFTKYATCLLPPSQNRLEIAISAGEKMYGDTH